MSKVLDKDIPNTFAWYNSICKFILEDETNLSLFENNTIIPDQYGIFKKKSTLFIDNIADEDLKQILNLLGEDWYSILLHRAVAFGTYYVKEKQDIANRKFPKN